MEGAIAIAFTRNYHAHLEIASYEDVTKVYYIGSFNLAESVSGM
jgi:hypothetical protein